MQRRQIWNLCKLAINTEKSWILDPYHLAVKQRIPKIFPKASSNASVLDVGCGPTPFYQSIEAKEYVGLDLYVPTLPQGFLFVLGDGRVLPFKTSSFDGVLCTSVLEHVDEDNRVLKEIHEVLKGDGVCLFVIPSSYYHDWAASKVTDHGYRGYSMESIRSLLQRNGFKIMDIHVFCGIPMHLYGFLMEKLVGRFFDLSEVSQESIHQYSFSDQEGRGKNQSQVLERVIANAVVRIYISLVRAIAGLDRVFPMYHPMLYIFLCEKHDY